MSIKTFLEAGKTYLIDYVGNISGPYNNTKEASEFAVASDIVLVALTPHKNTKDKTKEKFKEITLDFKTNSVYTKSTNKDLKITLDGFSYGVGAFKMAYKSWGNLIKDAYSNSDKVSIVGTPPVEGDCLDEMLYMQ